MGESMKKLLLAACIGLAALPMSGGSARANDPSCKVRATERKLAGAAQTSFMKKCQTDAEAACNTAATNRKLAGAAKTSFLKKCVSDAVGA